MDSPISLEVSADTGIYVGSVQIGVRGTTHTEGGYQCEI